MITCPKCGYEVEEGTGYCPNCDEMLNRDAKFYWDLHRSVEKYNEREKTGKKKVSEPVRTDRRSRYDDDDYVAPIRKEEKSSGYIGVIVVILIILAAVAYFFFFR